MILSICEVVSSIRYEVTEEIMSTLTNPGLQAKSYRNALVSANPAHTVPTGQLRVQCAPDTSTRGISRNKLFGSSFTLKVMLSLNYNLPGLEEMQVWHAKRNYFHEDQ
jgi:hypothetical protein